ncbi:MAG: ribonuclease P protein component [Nocardioides sp.]|nr:ribonuclease P protein component [Nocardioides sp.]
MLPRAHRLTDGRGFTHAVRRGRRAGGRHLVVHLWEPADHSEVPARAGLVVSKAVGPAVVRTRVKRRLRHLLRDRVGMLRTGSILVVRALPPAAEASSQALGADLDRALSRCTTTPAGASA